MPSNKEPARQVMRGTATAAAAPSKRQRVRGGSSGKQPKTSGGAKPAKIRSSSSGGNGDSGGTRGVQPVAASASASAAADLDCYNTNRPGGHVGMKASELLNRFVGSPEAMV
ncbi:unnamed protein product, partial [Ectocarpus sp. 13 AM-2016]